MPIYSYRCEDCDYAQDVLQKISDPPLAVCPSCGASAFRKQVTAAGFQLKGSGWYVTDFRNPQSAKAGAKAKGEKETGASDASPGSADSSGDKAAPSNGASANGKTSTPATSDASSSASDKGSAGPSPSGPPSTTASS